MANASVRPDKVKYDVSNAREIFEQYIKDFNKEYKDEADKEVHFKAFEVNLQKINDLNDKNPTATFGLNKFADYTDEERKSMFGLKSELVSSVGASASRQTNSRSSIDNADVTAQYNSSFKSVLYSPFVYLLVILNSYLHV